MVVGAAEEAEAVGQDFERPLAEHHALELHPLLEDAEDQLLLLEAGDFGELLQLGGGDQLGHRHPLQLGDVDVAVLGIVAGDGGADAADAFGRFVELFGQRERFFALELGQKFAVDVGVVAAVAVVAAARLAVAIGPNRGFQRDRGDAWGVGVHAVCHGC